VDAGVEDYVCEFGGGIEGGGLPAGKITQKNSNVILLLKAPQKMTLKLILRIFISTGGKKWCTGKSVSGWGRGVGGD